MTHTHQININRIMITRQRTPVPILNRTIRVQLLIHDMQRHQSLPTIRARIQSDTDTPASCAASLIIRSS